MKKQIMEIAKVVAGRFFLRVVLPCFVLLADSITRSRLGVSIISEEILV